uniref:FAD-binding protein n=1 Tax=Nocardia neocaledoniensis TaxID=236511 RepID=UPI002453F22F
AGCAAAIEAHDAGARVLILEKTDAEHAGGNTRVSGGAWFHHRHPPPAARARARGAPAGLPDDLIPDTLRVIELGGPDSAEERLRKATLDFAAAIRAAEDAAETARGERLPLSAREWREFWLPAS